MTGWFLLWYKYRCQCACVWNIAAFLLRRQCMELKCFNVLFDCSSWAQCAHSVLISKIIPRVKIHSHKLCLQISLFLASLSWYAARTIHHGSAMGLCMLVTSNTHFTPEERKFSFINTFSGIPNPMHAQIHECDIQDLKLCATLSNDTVN